MLHEVTPPEFEFYTLAEIKDLIGIDDVERYDTEVRLWLRAAVAYVERYTNRILRESVWKLTLPCFPRDSWSLEIPAYPVLSVDSVQYVNTSGVLTTWDASDYIAAVDGDPAVISPAPNTCWPATQARRPDAVRITFTAGYELQTDDTYAAPETLGLAVSSLVREYLNRRIEPSIDAEEPASVPVQAILEPFVRKPALPTSVRIAP